MAETSKCITISISQPQASVTIDRVYIFRNGVETTTIYKNESLSIYEFNIKGTVSGSTISTLTIKLLVNNNETATVRFSNVPPNTYTWTVSGNAITLQKGWSTIGDMLNALGLGSATSVNICLKLIW